MKSPDFFASSILLVTTVPIDNASIPLIDFIPIFLTLNTYNTTPTAATTTYKIFPIL